MTCIIIFYFERLYNFNHALAKAILRAWLCNYVLNINFQHSLLKNSIKNETVCY